MSQDIFELAGIEEVAPTEVLGGMSWDMGYDTLKKASPTLVTQPQTVSVHLAESWAQDAPELGYNDPVDATVKLTEEGSYYKLTKGTLLGLGKAASISRDLLESTPTSLIQPLMNYWLSTAEGKKGPSFTVDNSLATSIMVPSAVLPLTTYQLAKAIRKIIEDQLPKPDDCNQEIFFSSRMDTNHDRTSYALLVPWVGYGMENDDLWLAGVHVTVSDSGHTPPVITPYIERSYDGLGVIPAGFEAKYSVRKHGKQLDSVMEWLEAAVGVISVEMEDILTKFVSMYDMDISEDLSAILLDVLTAVKLPQGLKSVAVQEVEASDEADTAYGLATAVAGMQNLPDEGPERVEKIMYSAGFVADALGDRCPSCHQLSSNHTH